MTNLLAASASYILIDALLATVALAIGFFAALVYFQHTSPARGQSQTSLGEASEEQANLSQRADMAALQLRDLTHNVAQDVSDHTEVVGGFSSAINTAASSGDKGVITEAITAMLAANEKLQGRLAEAEMKIQAQAEELRTQQSEARTDALTKLANRRAFDAAMEKNVEGFARQGNPFSMLIFDVDHFKKFNDTHGHQAGDEVLRAVGRTLQKTVKSTDLPCRYGGEEFAVIMPNTHAKHARIAAERVRQGIQQMEVRFEGKCLRVTASVGVAELGPGEDAAKLIRRADDAVYASKEAGRNRGHWHDGVECLPVDQDSPEASRPVREVGGGKPAGGTPPETTDEDIRHLPNRTAFTDELRRRVSESQRFAVPLSVMLLRVRDFAALEVKYGEAVGELLLDSVASFIKSTLREMDLLGRYDRDEFVVMLPGSTNNEAKQVGKRVRAAISNCSIPLGSDTIKLGIHLGVAHIQPDDSAPELIMRARGLLDAAANVEANPLASV
jgi:diguanylate cyclase